MSGLDFVYASLAKNDPDCLRLHQRPALTLRPLVPLAVCFTLAADIDCLGATLGLSHFVPKSSLTPKAVGVFDARHLAPRAIFRTF